MEQGYKGTRHSKTLHAYLGQARIVSFVHFDATGNYVNAIAETQTLTIMKILIILTVGRMNLSNFGGFLVYPSPTYVTFVTTLFQPFPMIK